MAEDQLPCCIVVVVTNRELDAAQRELGHGAHGIELKRRRSDPVKISYQDPQAHHAVQQQSRYQSQRDALHALDTPDQAQPAQLEHRGVTLKKQAQRQA